MMRNFYPRPEDDAIVRMLAGQPSARVPGGPVDETQLFRPAAAPPPPPPYPGGTQEFAPGNDWMDHLAQATGPDPDAMPPPGYEPQSDVAQEMAGVPKPPGIGAQAGQMGGQIATAAALNEGLDLFTPGASVGPSEFVGPLGAPGGPGGVPAPPTVVGTTMTPNTMLGSIQAAPSFIPMAVIASTLMGANSAMGAFNEGKDKGALGGIKGGFNGFDDLLTAFATGGLSIPANIAASIVGSFQSGKDPDQKRRDKLRGRLRDVKVLDDDWNMVLDDGTTLRMGIDGKSKPYNVDFSKASAEQGIGWLQPLAYWVAEGNQKLADDFAGQIYSQLDPTGNMSPDELRDKILLVYQKLQAKPSMLTNFYNEAEQKGFLGADQKNAFLAAISSLRPGGGPQNLQPKTPAPGPSVASGAPPLGASTQTQAPAPMVNPMQSNSIVGSAPPPPKPKPKPILQSRFGYAGR